MSIQEYKANVKPGSRKDSLGQLIAARDENGIGLSHEEVVSAAFIFMVAGLTIPTNASWFKAAILLPWLLLTSHINWQRLPHSSKKSQKSYLNTRPSMIWTLWSWRGYLSWMPSFMSAWGCTPLSLCLLAEFALLKARPSVDILFLVAYNPTSDQR